MMKRYIFAFIAAIAAFGAWAAAPVETLTLTDGRVLKGYVAQRFENGDMTFHEESADRLTDRDHTLSYREIERIDYSHEDPDAAYGLRDVVILDDYTEIEGQMLSLVPGKTMTMLVKGDTVSVAVPKVLIKGKRALSDARTPMEQSRTVEKLWFRSGGRLEGVVMEWNYMYGTVTVYDIYRKENRTRSLLDLEQYQRWRNPHAITVVW